MLPEEISTAHLAQLLDLQSHHAVSHLEIKKLCNVHIFYIFLHMPLSKAINTYMLLGTHTYRVFLKKISNSHE